MAAVMNEQLDASVPDQLADLTQLRRWVCWRYERVNGRVTKVPYSATGGGKASSTDPMTWATLAELPIGAFDGPGIVLGDGLQGVDLDACLDDHGKLEGWAAEIVDRLASYTEVSPSGRGVKIIIRGPEGKSVEVGFGDPVTMPDGTPKRRELAYFTGGRYFTITGDVYRDAAIREVSEDDAQWLRDRIEEIRSAGKRSAGKKTPTTRPTVDDAMPGGEATTQQGGALPKGLPKWLRELVTRGAPESKRSEQFYRVVRKLGELGHDAPAIERMLRAHPHGIAKKYEGRLLAEIERALSKEDEREESPEQAAQRLAEQAQRGQVACEITDFYAFLPRASFLYVPTRDWWPACSVDTAVEHWPRNPFKDDPDARMKPSDWLSQQRPIHQMTWSPDDPMVIEDRVIDTGGWIAHPGARVFNLYRAPQVPAGDPSDVAPWLDHLRLIYPDEYEHIVAWLAHRVQRPGQKVNHALVLGGAQGIGKDSLLEPLKLGVGHWNTHEISPAQMMGRFNGWAKAVIVRVSEARDLGDTDRFAFYDHAKTYIAAPPDVIRVDEKNLREHYVVNVMGVIVTTNHKTDGIYLPEDDRRHFVAWSDATKEDFSEDYWRRLWHWYEHGGLANVVAYLRALDLSGFNPKAPPPKTAAFYAIVAAGQAPEDSELRDVLDYLQAPAVLTLEMVIGGARALGMNDLADELADRKNRRRVPHKLERAGYIPVRSPDAADGLFKIGGRRQVVYGRKGASKSEHVRAARAL